MQEDNGNEHLKRMLEEVRLKLNHTDLVFIAGNYIHGLGSTMRFGKYEKSKLSIRHICHQDSEYLV